MSYTLRGRVEIAASGAAAGARRRFRLAGLTHRWWPLELAAADDGGRPRARPRSLPPVLAYQPGWLALPLGAARARRSARARLRIRHRRAARCPRSRSSPRAGSSPRSSPTPASRCSAWLRRRRRRARAAGRCVAAVALVLRSAAPAARLRRLPAHRPPGAGVHQGPLVITRREVLQGEPGAVVRGGIVVAPTTSRSEMSPSSAARTGSTVDGVRRVVIDGVRPSGATLDGIHVRLAGVVIRNCTVDMLGNRLGQGIDISFNMDLGMSMVEGCTVVGGQQGITTHSSATDIMGNRVSRTTGQAIAVTRCRWGWPPTTLSATRSGSGCTAATARCACSTTTR